MELSNIYSVLISGDLELLSNLESTSTGINLNDFSPVNMEQRISKNNRNTPKNIEDFQSPNINNPLINQSDNTVNFNPVNSSAQKLENVDLSANMLPISELSSARSTNRQTGSPISLDNISGEKAKESITNQINNTNNTTNTSDNRVEEKNFYFQVKLNEPSGVEKTTINKNTFEEILRKETNLITNLQNLTTNTLSNLSTNLGKVVESTPNNISNTSNTENINLSSPVQNITSGESTLNDISNILNNKTINLSSPVQNITSGESTLNDISNILNNKTINLSSPVQNITSGESTLNDISNILNNKTINLSSPGQNMRPGDMISPFISNLYPVVENLTRSNETRNVFRENNIEEKRTDVINSQIFPETFGGIDNIPQISNSDKNLQDIIDNFTSNGLINTINLKSENLPNILSDFSNTVTNSATLIEGLKNIISQTNVSNLSRETIIGVNNLATQNPKNLLNNQDFSNDLPIQNSTNLLNNLKFPNNLPTNIPINTDGGTIPPFVAPISESITTEKLLKSISGPEISQNIEPVITTSLLEMSRINASSSERRVGNLLEPQLGEGVNMLNNQRVDTNRVNVEPMAVIRTNLVTQAPQVIREEPQLPVFQMSNVSSEVSQPQSFTNNETTMSPVPISPIPNIDTTSEKKDGEPTMSNQMLGGLSSQLAALTSVVREISTKLSYLDEDTNLSFK
jgi:hypothetical protein